MVFYQTNIFSVSEFLNTMNMVFSDVGLVKIKGEIDEVNLRGSYGFLSLKESKGGVKAEASLGCFVGWRCINKVQHLLLSGTEVIITGVPSIYVKSGSFRLEIYDIEPVGKGALQKAFEALKIKLSQKGYFDAERKRAIPRFIQNVGVITSLSGAAIIDFKKNLDAQGLRVEYIDVRVEGEHAEESIIRAIKKFNELRPNLDALILMRGGGSYESLQAFNSELVADAIYFSRIPVITGIGHEKDDTIADFVADMRCSTPTSVAKFLSELRESVQHAVETFTSELVYSLDGVFHQASLNMIHEQQKFIQNTEYMFTRVGSYVDNLEHQLAAGFSTVFHSFNALEQKFYHAAYEFDSTLRLMSEKTTAFEKQLMTLNPEAILERGYSIAYNEKGEVVRKVHDVENGEQMKVRVSDGVIGTQVKK